MCTAIVSIDPSSPCPVLLVGLRDEFAQRPWLPPDRHWADRPALIGGRDLQAGGTWLAVDPAAPRLSCVLNGHGPLAPGAVRLSRGELPLLMADSGKLGDLDPVRYDPFHLLCAEPDAVRLWSWDGADLTERSLGAGLHLVVNSGPEGADLADGPGVAEMSARLDHFRPRLAAARRPLPAEGTTAQAWGEWLPLVDGDGLGLEDPRALIVRRDFGDGRIWGTGSISLVALRPGAVRYDFSGRPGDPSGWHRVPVQKIV
jgi:Transport and Golgi organisation 2